jgi:hypothetical protein
MVNSSRRQGPERRCVRAEIHRLHETDDELRRRIESQEQRSA